MHRWRAERRARLARDRAEGGAVSFRLGDGQPSQRRAQCEQTQWRSMRKLVTPTGWRQVAHATRASIAERLMRISLRPSCTPTVP